MDAVSTSGRKIVEVPGLQRHTKETDVTKDVQLALERLKKHFSSYRILFMSGS